MTTTTDPTTASTGETTAATDNTQPKAAPPAKRGRQKRRRTANGDKDKNGNNRRRRNGAGTIIERRVTHRDENGRTYIERKWDARYYVTIDGVVKRKSKTLNATTVEEARAELEKLIDGQKTFSQERELQKAVDQLAGVRSDIAKAAEAEAQKLERERREEDERRAVAIADGWKLYVDSKKRPDSGTRTLAGYETQYKAFAKWCKKNHPDKPKMRDFTPAMAEEFIDHIEKSRSRNTRNKYLIFLRGFWRVLRWNADAQLTVDPWEGIRTITATPDSVTRRDITVEELGRIAEYLRSDKAKEKLCYTYKPTDGRKNPEEWDLRGEMLSLVALGVYLGARLGDCVTFKWSMVDLVLNTITYPPRKTVRKYKREVIAPLHPTLARLLMSIPAECRSGYVLPMLAEIYENREPSIITNRFQAVLRSVGIETATEAPKGEGGGTRARVAVGFHSLRHFFAAWLDNHGVNHSLTNYLTCHEQGKVEAGYYHGNREALAAAVATLPTIPALSTGENLPTMPTHSDDAESQEDIVIVQPITNAAEERFQAFCKIVNEMDPHERKRAIEFLAQMTNQSISKYGII